MKLLSASCILLIYGVAIAATPKQESEFLNEVRVAYSTTNVSKIIALYCWDGVPQFDRNSYPSVVERQLKFEERRVVSVDYMAAPELNHGRSITNNGAVTMFVPNLKPVRWIRIQFEPSSYSRHTLELEIGEKQGRLMIIHRIPKKNEN
jgi:hypothetical protein